MKVKLKKDVQINFRNYTLDDIVELDDSNALDIIHQGYGIEYKDKIMRPKKKKYKTK